LLPVVFPIVLQVVLKMLTKGIVPYLQGVGPLFALALAVISAAPLKSATSTYGFPDTPAKQNLGTVVDRFVPLSVGDYSPEVVDRVSVVDDAKTHGGVQSLVFTPDTSQEQPDEFSDVGRYRGLRKFLLLVFICGAIIRFFTSPTFLAFITDALDPKSW